MAHSVLPSLTSSELFLSSSNAGAALSHSSPPSHSQLSDAHSLDSGHSSAHSASSDAAQPSRTLHSHPSTHTTHDHTPISSNSSSTSVPPLAQPQPISAPAPIPRPAPSSAAVPAPVTAEAQLSVGMQKMALEDDKAAYNPPPPIPAPTSSTSTSSSSSSSSTSPPPSASGKKKAISYAAERVIGNGSFGVVYQATVIDTGETVAIKKVLQDRRFKNRELEIMSSLSHPNVVALRHCFYSKGEKAEEVYLNLVMEYIPETIHRTLRNHTKANKLVPVLYTKVYMYQIARALAYIHSQGICHRDIKPQNLLLNPRTHEVKLCDFGSAKPLHPGEPNVSYICSRYYRAPELVFEATEYTSMIDVWSLGCVFVELLIGNPLFPGDSGVGQLIEIIKVLGSPTREEVLAMNPTPTSFRFPHISPQPWSKVFRTTKVPPSAIDLASRWLRYKPAERMDPFDSLLHPFFDELREEGVRMPNGKELPDLFEWKDSERERMTRRGGGLYERMTPAWYRRKKKGDIVRDDELSAAPAANGVSDAAVNGHRAPQDGTLPAEMERDGT